MFHKSFVSGDHIEELPEVANESVNMFSSILDDPSSVGPASPGRGRGVRGEKRGRGGARGRGSITGEKESSVSDVPKRGWG